MRRRYCLFQKAKRSYNPAHKTQYKHVRNRITSQLHHAKQNYFRNLNPSDTKQFWKTIKVLNKQNVHCGNLTHNGIPCPSDLDKAESLNDFFTGCFNTSYQPIPNIPTRDTGSTECSPELLCTEDEGYGMLNSLDTKRASGPDGISACMLKYTAEAITPSVTKLFNISIRCCRLPSCWKISSVVPIPKVPKPTSTVPTFKYLGVLLSSESSWSQHIQGICSKARKILGLLYRRFYQHSNSRSLQQLYVTLVRPRLDYTAQVWDPHLRRDINLLKGVQKFALKICSKR